MAMQSRVTGPSSLDNDVLIAASSRWHHRNHCGVDSIFVSIKVRTTRGLPSVLSILALKSPKTNDIQRFQIDKP
jgi:hypothetical protein